MRYAVCFTVPLLLWMDAEQGASATEGVGNGPRDDAQQPARISANGPQGADSLQTATRRPSKQPPSPALVQRVLAHVDADELIRLTAELVRINSVWDPGAGTSEQLAAEYVERWAKRQGFSVQLEWVAPRRPNVIISHGVAVAGSPALMFEGHTDVVTPGDLALWKYDPFGAQIVDGRMYGRGTADTKGNLAAMLVAMAALKRSGVKLTGPVVGGVLCDEEGQMLGVQHFIAQGHADGITAAVICEPEDHLICTVQKGAIRASVSVRGKMSHGAMPLAGLNGAPAVARLIDGLHQLELAAVTTLGKDPNVGWPSFTPTVIQAPALGAGQLNVIPGDSQLLIDIRTLPDQSHPEVIRSLHELSKNVAHEVNTDYRHYDRLLGIERPHEIRIGLDILTDRPSTRTDKNDPIVRAAHWARRTLTGRQPTYGGVPGSTDGTYLWSMRSIPIVTMGAGDRFVPHQANEWVDLDQLVETAKLYVLTALHYLH